MPALGHKQTFAMHQVMSALPPIATLIAFFGISDLGHKRTPGQFKLALLFDDLVSEAE
jgi:hypothetical protein